MAPGTGDQERQALTRLVRRRARDEEDARLLLDAFGLLGAPAARPRRRGRPPVDRGHGHPTTYRKGCRCDDCRDATRARRAAQAAQRAADPAAADRAGHGRAGTYKHYGCRCDDCRAANTADARQRRAAAGRAA